MTTVNKCPDCNALLLRAGSCESCGWPKVRPKHAERPAFTSSPSKAVSEAMAARLSEVNAFIAKYQAEHPGSSKKEACFAYLKRKKIELPAFINAEPKPERSFDDAMDDYRAEQKASVG